MRRHKNAMKTFKYRLKDKKQAKLARMSSSVNCVWNYCSEVSRENRTERAERFECKRMAV